MRGLPIALLAAACSSPSASPEELTVLAASSLSESYAALAQGFEAAHPEVEVVLATAGSQALATQIRHGIPADVFASADEDHIASLARSGLVVDPRPFAANTLVLAISTAYPHPVTLETLPSVGSLVLGGPEVPVGRYADALLDASEARLGPAWRTEVDARVVSREPNARLVVAKVGMGEADAALVYRTDLATADGLRGVPLPSDLAPEPTYFHAALGSAASPELAQSWLEWVESDAGGRILAAHGFAVGGSHP